ncbi:hypothetical protein F5Y15DRAFT_73385 [Xylariaceae sp. FL0016]|nr:hypothetical protein F5Y15DRAFT_73385 [Xylariaceae sp. FL0016]
MAPTPRSEAHLSPPQTDKLRRGTPSDRSDRSDQSPDSSEKGYTSSLRSTESRPTRKRASRPKVRTGCISCKKRHVSGLRLSYSQMRRRETSLCGMRTPGNIL